MLERLFTLKDIKDSLITAITIADANQPIQIAHNDFKPKLLSIDVKFSYENDKGEGPIRTYARIHLDENHRLEKNHGE